MKDEIQIINNEEVIVQKSSFKRVKRLPIAITQIEFLALLEKTKSDKHKFAFLLGFESGLRISEVTKLEARDVNISEGKIFIRQGKGSKDRVVPLPKHFREKYIQIG